MIAPMIAPIGRVACSVINLSLSHDRSHDRSAVIEADQSKMDQVHGGRGDYIRGPGVLSVEDFGMGPWDSWCRASRCISLGFVEVHVVVMVVVVGTFGSSLKILSQALNMRHQCAMSLHIGRSTHLPALDFLVRN